MGIRSIVLVAGLLSLGLTPVLGQPTVITPNQVSSLETNDSASFMIWADQGFFSVNCTDHEAKLAAVAEGVQLLDTHGVQLGVIIVSAGEFAVESPGGYSVDASRENEGENSLTMLTDSRRGFHLLLEDYYYGSDILVSSVLGSLTIPALSDPEDLDGLAKVTKKCRELARL